MIVKRDSFEDVLSKLSQPGEKSLDTETTGLRAYHDDSLFSLIIADSSDVYYFNFQVYAGFADSVILTRKDLCRLKPIFEEPKNRWFLTDAKFDMSMLAREGLFLKGEIHCTVALGRVERNDEMKYSLDACAKRIGLSKSKAVEEYILKHKLWEWKQIPGKQKREKNKHFDQVPFHVITPYGEQDARTTWAVAQHQNKMFLEMHNSTAEGLPSIQRVVENEKRFTKTCFKIEQTGVQIDLDYCNQALQYEESRMAEALHKFKDLTRVEFKDSNALLQKVFEGYTPSLTKKGNISFDTDALTLIDLPVARVVEECRDASKKMNTYYRNFLYYKDNKDRIHANLKQGGTGTGRISCTDPALQTLPKKDEELHLPFRVRKVFIPTPGNLFIMLDYNQMEYRMMLDYAQQRDVIEEVKAGLDVHDATAKLTGTTRAQAKTLNFGLLYGMGIGELAHALKTTSEKASNLKRSYFQALPFVKGLIKRATYQAEAKGYIFNWMGRRSYFKDLKFAYRACNYLIQGGCADAVKLAMNNIHDLLEGYETKMVMQVHDELVFDMPHKELHLVPQIKELMETAYPYKHLRLTCSVEHSFVSLGDRVDGLP